ncbi:MAG TPA: hypothetical protein VGK59_22405 [Ohtaekwangia sp.]
MEINLSPKNQQKLSAIESGHRRMMKFYKFYKRDSTRYMRMQEKKHQGTMDSAWRAIRDEEKRQKRLVKRGVSETKLLSNQFYQNEISKQWSVLRDSTITDSIRQLAKDKIKGLVLENANQYPGFQHLKEPHQLYGDSVNWSSLSNQVRGLDTLSSVFDVGPEQLFQMAEQKSMKRLLHADGMKELASGLTSVQMTKDLLMQYKAQYGSYSNVDSLKSVAKQKAVEEAIDYFEKNAGKLQMAQNQVSKLASKYKSFTNSSDLSTAVKRTSMQGSTFWERLVIGGTFNMVSTKPVVIDIAPQVGYKFTTRFVVGAGFSTRSAFGQDSIKHGWYVSPTNTAYKIFSSYDIYKSFYASVEWESSWIKEQQNDVEISTYINNYFIGLGKRFLIHPKLYMTVLAQYNLNSMEENPSYLRRFQIKFGLQSSELAFRKKPINYDPNR